MLFDITYTFFVLILNCFSSLLRSKDNVALAHPLRMPMLFVLFAIKSSFLSLYSSLNNPMNRGLRLCRKFEKALETNMKE
ncbi:hypothetical protein CLOSTMETH_00583 [[Clostridium] methylpentosum DSM 5476]|uniref:Uncharacterized protein n=1 Tax=[Clostridium] methylpentosum DSM 5476 TaxID=537013 RepID=C0E9T2_9FIRM|nr:hypothetical protein CLOSTMETH_00583 [[Clostridium] methylpentosum DSM 5476]